MSLVAGDFVGDHEDDLKAIAVAIADKRPSDVAGSAAALLVKLLTGSSILAGSAEKLAARTFGKWLADNPDARLEQAAQAFAASDRKRADVQAFAASLRPVLDGGMRVLATLDQGQQRTHEQLADLEALMAQALRATALVQAGQEDLKAMIAGQSAVASAVDDDGLFDAPRYPSSVRRSALTQKIHAAVSSHAVVALVGMSGSGKSYVASSYLETHRAAASVLWYDPEAGETLDSLLLALTQRAELPATGTSARCKKLVAWLRRNDQLLVIDDYHSVEQTSYSTLIEHVARNPGPARLLLLSQTFVEPQAVVEVPHQISIEGYSAEEVSEYMSAHALASLDSDMLASLIDKTGGLPFAVMLFAMLVGKYGRDAAELLEGSIAESSRVRAWFENVARSVGTEPLALLKRLSLCTGAFGMDIVRVLCPDTRNAALQENFERLQQCLLVQQYSDTSWKLHDFVANICRTDLNDDAREQIHAALGDYYLSKVPGTRRRRNALDPWTERACREFLKTKTRQPDGQRLLNALTAPAKAEGKYDLILELSRELVGLLSGEDCWVDYNHAHSAWIVGADVYALRIIEPLSEHGTRGCSALLSLAATRLRAEILTDRGQVDLAIASLRDKLASYVSADARDRIVVSHSRTSLAQFLISVNELEQAERILASLMAEAKQHHDQRGLAIMRTSQASVWILKNKLPRARKLLDEAQKVFQQVGDRRGDAWVSLTRAELELRAGNPQAAFDIFQHAERLHSEIGQATLRQQQHMQRMAALTTHADLRIALETAQARITQARALATKRFARYTPRGNSAQTS